MSSKKLFSRRILMFIVTISMMIVCVPTAFATDVSDIQIATLNDELNVEKLSDNEISTYGTITSLLTNYVYVKPYINYGSGQYGHIEGLDQSIVGPASILNLTFSSSMNAYVDYYNMDTLLIEVGFIVKGTNLYKAEVYCDNQYIGQINLSSTGGTYNVNWLTSMPNVSKSWKIVTYSLNGATDLTATTWGHIYR